MQTFDPHLESRQKRAFEVQASRDAGGPRIAPNLLIVEVSCSMWRAEYTLSNHQVSGTIAAVSEMTFSEPSTCAAIYEAFKSGRHREPNNALTLATQAVALAAKQQLSDYLKPGARLSVEIVDRHAVCMVDYNTVTIQGRRPGPAKPQPVENGTFNTIRVSLIPGLGQSGQESELVEFDPADSEAAKERHANRIRAGEFSHHWGEIVASHKYLAQTEIESKSTEKVADCAIWLFATAEGHPAMFADFIAGGKHLAVNMHPGGNPDEYTIDFQVSQRQDLPA